MTKASDQWATILLLHNDCLHMIAYITFPSMQCIGWLSSSSQTFYTLSATSEAPSKPFPPTYELLMLSCRLVPPAISFQHFSEQEREKARVVRESVLHAVGGRSLANNLFHSRKQRLRTRASSAAACTLLNLNLPDNFFLLGVPNRAYAHPSEQDEQRQPFR